MSTARRVAGEVAIYLLTDQPVKRPSVRLIPRGPGFSTLEPMRNSLHALWAESRATEPPARLPRDYVLVAVLIPIVVIEGLFQPDLAWRAFAIPYGVALSFTLLWRRTHPLAMVALALGSFTALDIASSIFNNKPVELYAGAFALILVYSLFRWGAGRDTAIGFAVMIVALVTSLITDFTGIGDAIGGSVVLMFPAVLGLDVRYWIVVRRQRLERFQSQEREQLARELHDTVAHHVSAIAIQAQAGRILAGTSSPERAVEALEVIEEEASRALAEMRSIVTVLRDGEASPDLSPQQGVAELGALAAAGGPDAPVVDVEMCGELEGLRPSVESAVYRIAQESITNAVRHARNVSRVEVRVEGGGDSVRLTVSDDGEAVTTTNLSGYGLVGMNERASLLGGTLDAGPSPDRGWTVRAVLPRRGTPS